MRPNLWQRIRLKRATQMLEGAASLQLVCPYCQEIPTNTVVHIFLDEVHICEDTYSGKACGRSFIGPGPSRRAS